MVLWLSTYFDAALLKPNATPNDLKTFCQKCIQYGVYAADINPCYVGLAKSLLKNSNVKVLSVVGFPLGANTTETKVFEAKQAIKSGADELDMVMAVGQFKAKNYDYVRREIEKVVDVAKGRPVKVIIEAGYLTKAEIIKACEIVKNSGATFVKDCSGWGPKGADPKIVKLIRKAVGPNFGIKSAGGIRTLPQTLKLISAGANRIGSSAAFEIIESWERKAHGERKRA
ncbi:MAG: deoxyribose-phosphate aldolase [Candidatus Nanoarchaeia archaeon]